MGFAACSGDLQPRRYLTEDRDVVEPERVHLRVDVAHIAFFDERDQARPFRLTRALIG